MDTDLGILLLLLALIESRDDIVPLGFAHVLHHSPVSEMSFVFMFPVQMLGSPDMIHITHFLRNLCWVSMTFITWSMGFSR
jgi:hypothetical protein